MGKRFVINRTLTEEELPKEMAHILTDIRSNLSELNDLYYDTLQVLYQKEVKNLKFDDVRVGELLDIISIKSEDFKQIIEGYKEYLEKSNTNDGNQNI